MELFPCRQLQLLLASVNIRSVCVRLGPAFSTAAAAAAAACDGLAQVNVSRARASTGKYIVAYGQALNSSRS